MVRHFLVFTYIWQEDFAKISKVPDVPRNVNLARSITWLVSVSIYCPICLKQFTSTQSCTVSRPGLFGSGSGRVRAGFAPEVDKNFRLKSGLRRAFCFDEQKYNLNN